MLDVAPSTGGSTLAGDTVTNRLIDATWSGVYRVVGSDLTNTQRALITLRADTAFLGPVSSGNYWLDVGLAGTLSSGPWTSSTVPVRPDDNGEALFGTWAPLLDPDLGQGHDL